MGLTRINASQISNIDYKQAVRVVSLTNVTLAGGAPNVVDGVTLSVNDRVLVAGQSTGSQNGIYYVQTVGAGSTGTWVRTIDASSTGQILGGMLVMVSQGTTYADTVWELTTDDPITVGTTSLTFVQSNGSSSLKSGNSNVSVTTNGNVTVSSGGTAGVLTVSSTGVVISGTGSVTGNVTGGNLLTSGLISATGNITGNYIFGNGSQLTGISAGGGTSITNGTSNVSVAASGNVTVGVAGTAAVATFTTTGIQTGNITNSNANGVGNIGSSTTYFNTVFAKATSAQYADLAEMYLADSAYLPGTVLVFGGINEVTTSAISHDTAVAGIVSTNPSYLMNSGLNNSTSVALALTGRVPCQVQGPVQKGDRLVNISPGVAGRLDMNQYEPGCIIGKSLESINDNSIQIIEVAVGRY